MLFKIAIVQAYINHFAGKTVQIKVPTTYREIMLLDKAYQKAMSILKEVNTI